MPAQRKKVAISTMALMTVGTVVSLNALPMMAAEGLSLIFYILFATVVFLLPAAMVSAEISVARPPSHKATATMDASANRPTARKRS